MPEDVNIVVEVDSATAICANHMSEIEAVSNNLTDINTVLETENISDIHAVSNDLALGDSSAIRQSVTAMTAAAASATNAASSASTASTKASEASVSATNAATSANTASTKASEASTSATNAANSASSASASATSAANDAATATTKAGEASTSATNAAASASTATSKANVASSSADSANASASFAASSAANASTSAGEAATSALSAETSASTATTKANEASASATTASTKASEASTSATNAASSAASALASANTASTKATEAATSASSVATVVATATNQANIATAQAALAKQYAEETHGASDVTLANLRAVSSYRGYEYPQTDAQGLADVNYYTHSNYDNTKFTKVGSPVITADGIASGFQDYSDTAEAYLKLPSITFGKAVKMTFDFKLNSFGDEAIIGRDGVNSAGIFISICSATEADILLLASDDSIIVEDRLSTNYPYTFSLNTNYRCTLTYNGSRYIITIEEINNGECPFIHYIDSSKILMGGSLTLGVTIYGNAAFCAFSGDIDLKSFSIVSEGKTIFTGNKTGVDTKKSDYTPLPTSDPCPVTPDGVASGFSATKYVASDYELTTDYSTLEIDLGEVVINELPESGTKWIFDGRETNSSITKGFWFGLYYNGHSRFFAGSGTSNYDIANAQEGNITYSVGQKVKFKLVFDGTIYKLYSSVNGGTWTQDGNAITSSAKINFDTTIKIGSDGSNYFSGSIDLNHMRIITDDKVVWQPCLKIPYILSKTGSKVVDAAYRDRIADYYEQYGYAPYYTLSDTDFTVPQGDIFGIIAKLIEEATA